MSLQTSLDSDHVPDFNKSDDDVTLIVFQKLAEKKLGKAGEIFFAVAVAVSTLGNAMCASLAASRLVEADILHSLFILFILPFSVLTHELEGMNLKE